MTERKKYIDDAKDDIIKLYRSGMTMTKIAKLYDTTSSLLTFRFREWNIITRTNKDYGKKNRITLICNYCKKSFSVVKSRKSINFLFDDDNTANMLETEFRNQLDTS